ncbi:hypothetical protein GGI25_004694 [Coemansia spiralis]|uniref:Uncharacterized protein n=2 Tax=Coemansia TaxID=4863 RepID=A0A9W8G536_9FUNG|nr:hypothetical protein EDC05_004465 [Coemansia umbellata]KAJ2621371.1 hypothetical protein GGI26_004153 [Coemansia sp. RSA 1358]KAJ2673432.1 hypothetical protein GGI25_004694 [Coemansia spiralis]
MTAQNQPARETYPWPRVLTGCFLVIICWAIGVSREYPEQTTRKLQTLEHYVFSQLWSRLSSHSHARIHPHQKPLWQQLHGNILEIGPGYGDALQYMRPPINYVALEPNQFLHPRLEHNIKKRGLTPVIVNGTLDSSIVPQEVLDNAPYDFVVTSLVLCSVRNVEANLQAIYRLLRPGGKYVFIEHVHHADGAWRTVQSLVSKVAWPFIGNCHFDRDTGSMIKQLKWHVDYTLVSEATSIETRLTPLIIGTATK